MISDGRKWHAEFRLNLRGKRCRRERIAAEIKEIVAGADNVDAEHPLPNGCQGKFRFSPRLDPRRREIKIATPQEWRFSRDLGRT